MVRCGVAFCFLFGVVLGGAMCRGAVLWSVVGVVLRHGAGVLTCCGEWCGMLVRGVVGLCVLGCRVVGLGVVCCGGMGFGGVE